MFRYDVMRANEDAYVNDAIQSMDQHFTLILLTDYFDESLILMKHLLCWQWDDIVYIKFKMRIEEAKAEVKILIQTLHSQFRITSTVCLKSSFRLTRHSRKRF